MNYSTKDIVDMIENDWETVGEVVCLLCVMVFIGWGLIGHNQ